MDDKPIRGTTDRAQTTGSGKQRRRPGLKLKERAGSWYIEGTLKLPTGSVRVRESTGYIAGPETEALADQVRFDKEKELRDEAIHGRKPSLGCAAAAYRYLKRSRKSKRPVGASTVRIIKEIGQEFGLRKLNEIPATEWVQWVDARQAGNKPETRERFINTVLAFLNWTAAKNQTWLEEVPEFERDADARNPNERASRRVQDLRPELIRFLISHASPHLKGQLAVEWSTGARVSSILYGCRVCDLVIGAERNQITFHKTKNGRTVTSALHPYAVELLLEYLDWRGSLHDREANLFLTHRRQPYADNGRDGGGQTHTAFNAMKRRAMQTLLEGATEAAAEIGKQGDIEGAAALLRGAEADADLIKQITPHWFRHLLATKMLQSTGGDLRTTADQGGWTDFRSVMGYAMDVPAHRHDVVASLDFGDNESQPLDAFLTQRKT